MISSSANLLGKYIGVFGKIWNDYNLSQMERNINDNPLQSMLPAAIKQGGFEQPGGLIMQKRLPPAARDEFREDNRCKLAIIMLHIGLFQELQERRDNRTIGRRDNHHRDIRPPGFPFQAGLFP